MRFAGYLLALSISACTSGPTARQLHEIGSPDVAFLQATDDLTVFNVSSSESAADVAGCLLFVGAALCAVYGTEATWFERTGVEDKEGQLTKYTGEIQTLGFNDKTYALFDSIVEDTAWLTDKKPHRVRWPRDAAFYTKQSAPTNVLYIQPVFALTPDGQDFIVYVTAGIQKMALNYPHGVYDFRRQEFVYTHHLTLAKPGMSWAQQKDLAHEVASMHPDQAIQAWFADDGALMKADFAEDMQQLDRGLRELFWVQEATAARVPGK